MADQFNQLGQYTFQGPVGIGTTSPSAQLQVSGGRGDIKALRIDADQISASNFFGNGSALTNIRLDIGSVSTNQLQDNSVTTLKIQNGAITREKLDPSISLTIPNGGVGTLQLADNAVTTPKIADNSITTLKIQNGAITREKLDPSISLSIPNGGIGTLQLADNAVTTPKIADNSVTTLKIQNGAITREKLDPSISLSIPNGGIGTLQLADNAVTTPKIADNSVTTLKIQNGAITREKLDPSISFGIPNSGVGTAQLADNAVTTPKIADKSITREKLAFDISGGGGSSQWQGADGGPISYTKGNVGIGTNNPQDKLDLAGNLRILTDSNPIRFTSAWSGFPDSKPNQAEISNDTGTFQTLMIVGNKSADGVVRKVRVWDRLEINGALVPSFGNSEMAGIMFPRDPGGGGGDAAWIRYYARTGEATTLEIGTSNDPDDHIALMSSGNVGIGTIQPSAKLEVAGNLKLQAGVAVNQFSSDVTLNGNSDLNVPTEKAVKTYIDSKLTGGGSSQWQGVDGGPISYTKGNVGIGTTNPQDILEVNGSLRVSAKENNSNALNLKNDSGFWHISGPRSYESGNNLSVFWHNNSNFSSPYLTVSDNGNVGIGTNTPQAKLQIANGAIMPSVGNAETAGIMFPKDAFTGSGDAAWIRYYARTGEATTLEIGISNDADDHIALMSSGNVGVGTTDPQGKLDVRGDIRAGNSDIYFTKTDHNHTGIGNTKGYAAIENGANFDALMILGRAGTSKGRNVRLWDYLQVNGSMDITGKLGIGTQNPEAVLHVVSPDQTFGGDVKLFPTSGLGVDFSYNGGSDGIFGFTSYGKEDGETRFQWQGPDRQFRGLLFITNRGEVRGRLVNTSSKELKENITDFSTQEAIEALASLNPVKFNYREDTAKEPTVGFIAEDVPELLATHDRKGVCALDIVAVLTKVIKQQQQELSCLKERLNALEASV